MSDPWEDEGFGAEDDWEASESLEAGLEGEDDEDEIELGELDDELELDDDELEDEL
jgi:hypothetical protein